MPKYMSKKKRGQKRNRERIKRAIPRDRRHLLQWAVDGTDANYETLRKHAAGLLDQVPSYIDKDAVAAIASGASRETVAKEIITEKQKKGNWFTDSLAWLFDQIPDDWELEWFKNLGEAALKPYRGTTMTEEDEIYAQLVNQSYSDNKPEEVGDWSRVPEFDSEYVNVWDNVDGHRFIGVRGTELRGGRGSFGGQHGRPAGRPATDPLRPVLPAKRQSAPRAAHRLPPSVARQEIQH